MVSEVQKKQGYMSAMTILHAVQLQQAVKETLILLYRTNDEIANMTK
jgi:hypothetical protein